jgi:cell division protein FtsI/penicillin-binding protein 2
MSLGAFKFYDYLERFGFGQPTGVDVAYEVTGWLRVPGDRDWHESDLGTNSFGQGLAVTPLQMLCAVSAVANRGVLMRPHVLHHVVRGGEASGFVPEAIKQVISPEAAMETTRMLVHAVDTVLTTASIPGYQVAGKSGTSEIPVMGTYDPQATIASFAGYAPAYEPRLSVLVVIDRPQKDRWGMTVAAPVFRDIAEQALAMLAVPPDSVRTSMR